MVMVSFLESHEAQTKQLYDTVEGIHTTYFSIDLGQYIEYGRDNPYEGG